MLSSSQEPKDTKIITIDDQPKERKKIKATFKNTSHSMDFSNQNTYIPISHNGLKATTIHENVHDELYLSAYLDRLQLEENELVKKNKHMGKVRIIITTGLAHTDYPLKFNDDIDALFADISKKHHSTITELSRQQNPEAQLAGFFGEVFRPLAEKKEEKLISRYSAQLQKIKKRPGFTLDCEVVGWSTIESESSYQRETKTIQKKLENTQDIFQKTLCIAAIKFINSKGGYRETKADSHGTKPIADLSREQIFSKLKIPKENSELFKTISVFKKYFGDLAINWLRFFVECSVAYLTKESPFFLMHRGKLLYGSALIEEIFQELLQMNPALEFIQMKCEPVIAKKEGLSESYFIKDNKVVVEDFPGAKVTAMPDSKTLQPSSSRQIFETLQISTSRILDAIVDENYFIPGPDKKNLQIIPYPSIKFFEGKTKKWIAPSENSSLKYILNNYYHFLSLLPQSPEKDYFLLHYTQLSICLLDKEAERQRRSLCF